MTTVRELNREGELITLSIKAEIAALEVLIGGLDNKDPENRQALEAQCEFFENLISLYSDMVLKLKEWQNK